MDLAGFTALTEAHGDHAAADLIDRFAELVTTAIGDRAQVVKSIGDALMLASLDPAAAVDAMDRLLKACYSSEGFPEPRAGLHHGPVVKRGADYFGATVNLAARVAGEASGGQTVGTEPIARAAAENGFRVIELGQHRFRNVSEAVDLWLIDIQPADDDTAIDPVCRMRVERRTASGVLDHDGHRYWFCSLDCVGRFASKPDQFTD